jgi:hypothetical protein
MTPVIFLRWRIALVERITIFLSTHQLLRRLLVLWLDQKAANQRKESEAKRGGVPSVTPL